jgi:hypothetical protein
LAFEHPTGLGEFAQDRHVHRRVIEEVAPCEGLDGGVSTSRQKRDRVDRQRGAPPVRRDGGGQGRGDRQAEALADALGPLGDRRARVTDEPCELRVDRQAQPRIVLGEAGERVHRVAEHDPVVARVEIPANERDGTPPPWGVERELPEDLGDVPLHRRLVDDGHLLEDALGERLEDRVVRAAHLLERVGGAHAHVLVGIEHAREQLADPRRLGEHRRHDTGVAQLPLRTPHQLLTRHERMLPLTDDVLATTRTFRGRNEENLGSVDLDLVA